MRDTVKPLLSVFLATRDVEVVAKFFCVKNWGPQFILV